MLYTCTRDHNEHITASEAICRGISPGGGLYVPESLPHYGADTLSSMVPMTYRQRAKKVLGDFLSDFTADEIDACVENAYRDEKFGGNNPTPLHKLDDGTYMLELWHGPTCAFKDMALQILPHLLSCSMKRVHPDRTAVILVATSGDTGKAALEGFRDVPGTKVLVFYPCDGVSDMQKRQMVTQEGDNVGVCAIEGNFDDAQTAVKTIFTDEDMKRELAEHGMMFSSANSINWGRLLPQIVYYFSAYCDMVANGAITMGDAINIVVPTGNFGNILAAYYASQMGLPVHKFVCASNANNVLTDFLTTGVYDKRRPFHCTTSPSMDILVSSNLERLLYQMSGCDDEKVKAWMHDLAANGVYTVDAKTREAIETVFAAGWCSDEDAARMIARLENEKGYLCDTHTAVAASVYEAYRAKTGDTHKTVIASTASAYKFPQSVLEALGVTAEGDGFAMAETLCEKTGEPMPAPLKALRDKPVRFTETCAVSGMKDAVRRLSGV